LCGGEVRRGVIIGLLLLAAAIGVPLLVPETHTCAEEWVPAINEGVSVEPPEEYALECGETVDITE
jgi:hypothetical protein